MDVQPLTLEELIEESTNINNYASNDAQAHAVSDAVNRTIGGSNTTVKLLIQKIGMRQEVVTLQALNVVEVCVKNCGARFHSEIGKYKFINELIKLLSPKYDGAITPVSVKERVVSLMFSWYVGLPHEAKIGEAYKMLKQQGLIKRDPVDPSRVADKPLPREKENTAFEDEGNAQLLKTLLASKDEEDLHSANKLIKNMVKEEEERLDRVSKRIQVLETVANNVKLLDDMIGKHHPKTNASSIEIMNELYERCLTLRPELFRLASKNVDDKAGDDSVGEILAASDELTRVIDLYKESVLFKRSGDNGVETGAQPETADSAFNSTCLLDLDMSSPVAEENIPNSLLDEQFKLLGLVQESNKPMASSSAAGYAALQNNFNINTGSYQEQPVQPVQPVQPMFGSLSSNSNMLPNNSYPTPNNSYPTPNNSYHTPNVIPPYHVPAFPPQSTVVRPVAAPPPAAAPAPKKDLFDFDIFDSEFLKPSKIVSNGTSSTKVADNSLEDQLLCLEPLTIPSDDIGSTLPPSQVASMTLNREETFPASLPPPMVAPSMSLPVAVVEPSPVVPVVIPTPNQPPIKANPTPIPEPYLATIPTPVLQPAELPAPVNNPAPSTPQAIPAQVLNTVSQPPAPASPVNYLVPLDALKTGKHTPIPLLDKDGLKTFLMLAEDTREIANPNVIVSILSTVSLNTTALTNFSIQVAVPKIMRVKLQPPTGTGFAAFNPFAPPPSISQVMLIANPTKEIVKLRFKIMYTLGGQTHVETANIDELPVK